MGELLRPLLSTLNLLHRCFICINIRIDPMTIRTGSMHIPTYQRSHFQIVHDLSDFSQVRSERFSHTLGFNVQHAACSVVIISLQTLKLKQAATPHRSAFITQSHGGTAHKVHTITIQRLIQAIHNQLFSGTGTCPPVSTGIHYYNYIK